MWQTIGQPKASTLLKHSLSTNNLSHAYLFVGPPHVGKTTMALDLAQALNCQRAEPPCGECESCRRIVDGKHADIIFIGLDTIPGLKETTPRVEIGIDAIEDLQRSANLPPYEGKYKVFIINGTECLSSEAANRLLKTLEEPPPKVILLLLTSEELRLLPTIVSRCQRVELKPMPSTEVQRVLIESQKLDSEKAKLLARLSHGCLGWALTASVNGNQIEQRAQMLSDMFSLLNASLEERFVHAFHLGNDRRAAEVLIKLWLGWWHDVMLTKCCCQQAITNVDYVSTLEEWAETLSLPEITGFINSLEESLRQISKNANLRLVVEILMLDMPRKGRKPGRQ